jgi:hypothetical protein
MCAAPVAQRIEQPPSKRLVAGSSPAGGAYPQVEGCFWTAKLSGQTVQSAVAVLAIERVIRRSNALSLRVRMVKRDNIYGSASARP